MDPSGFWWVCGQIRVEVPKFLASVVSMKERLNSTPRVALARLQPNPPDPAGPADAPGAGYGTSVWMGFDLGLLRTHASASAN